MLIFLFIVWYLLECIAVRMEYYGWIKLWYDKFGEDYRDYNEGNNASQKLLLSAPIIALLGPIFFLCVDYKYACWYFKVPKKS